MSIELGIIGYPIGHSISPVFQQAALDHCGIDATYQAWEIQHDEVGSFVNALRRPGMLGINVTVPHKEAVIPFLDEVDDWAAEAGAVNTIVNRDGRLTGHNTDGAGFLRALREGAGFEPSGRKVLVLGAGGAARGVVLALLRDGVAQLVVANRTLQRAEALVRLASSRDIPARATSLDSAELFQAAAEADLIVNSTTQGMAHGPDEGASLLSREHIPPTALVNDLVYNPPRTPLLHEAEQAGASTLGGIQMLVYQGAASFEMWFGQPAPVPVMLEAASQAMRARSQPQSH